MRFRAANADDLAYVRALAQRPENWLCLTDEDDAALTRYMADPTARLLIWQDEVLRGFALFCDVGLPGHVVELRRLCLDQPGRGEWARFVQALADLAFEDFGASRLWLDCSAQNLRAQRVYLREGFTLEGRLRGHDYFAMFDRYDDALLYGMLRDEWLGLARRSGLAAPRPDA